MVPRSPSRNAPAASLLPLLGSCVALAGCNNDELGRLIEAIAVAIFLIIVLQFLVWAAMFIVLVVNIVKLGRDKPSRTWGAVSAIMGAMTGLPAFTLLATHFNLVTLGSVAFSGALLYFGYKNMRGASDLDRWKRIGQD